MLRSVVAGAGGKPDSLKTITIGYNAVPDLIGDKVAAATSVWNDGECSSPTKSRRSTSPSRGLRRALLPRAGGLRDRRRAAAQPRPGARPGTHAGRRVRLRTQAPAGGYARPRITGQRPLREGREPAAAGRAARLSAQGRRRLRLARASGVERLGQVEVKFGIVKTSPTSRRSSTAASCPR